MRFIPLLWLIGAFVVCAAAPAGAGGRIALYADADRQGCELVDVYPGVVQIHIFYEGDLAAQSVLFAAPTPECWKGAAWIGDVVFDPFLSGLGDTHDPAKGAMINLRGCRAAPVYLGYMSFMHEGRSRSCCIYEITGSQDTEDPSVIDCDGEIVAVETGDLLVNPNPGCGCSDGLIVVATERTTWGQVKSLYR